MSDIEIVRRIKSQETTAEEHVHSLINRIHKKECKIHAYITHSKDAIEKARVIDSKIKTQVQKIIKNRCVVCWC